MNAIKCYFYDIDYTWDYEIYEAVVIHKEYIKKGFKIFIGDEEYTIKKIKFCIPEDDCEEYLKVYVTV